MTHKLNITVIIPTAGRNTINQVTDALKKQTRRPDEVLVVTDTKRKGVAWARNKGIYSQNYSYLGGAAFSIMLAKICQLYPNYSSLQLLDRFFFIYANWVWTVPVMLEKIDYP